MITLPEMFEMYAKEKGFGPRVVEFEGKGFATFHITGNECYLEDIFVMPEFRKLNVATEMANAVVLIAKNHKCKTMTGSVCLKANGKEASMKALLSYGMSPFNTNGDMVYFSKEI